MNFLHRTPTALTLLLSIAFLVGAGDPAPADSPPSVAEIFERTLDREGLDAALDSLQVALADSGRSYEIDAFELGIGLPARLVVRRQRDEALALVQALQPLFGDHPRYWQELAMAHLRCGHADEAGQAFVRASEASPHRPDLVWMAENTDRLAALARRQAALEDRLVPGDNTGLTGPYLGQTPPGRTPEPFAPGILSTTAHEYHISFSTDGREILFSRGGVGTLRTRLADEGWTVPEVLYLIDEDHLTEEANFTGDGQAVVFCGRADVHEPRILYRIDRKADGWGEPIALFPGMYGTAARNGTLYYTAEGEGRDYGAIVRRARLGDGYGEPEQVPGKGINSEFPDAHPWIAPDEDLLVFDTYRDPGMGLYVSFGEGERGWSPAVFLNDKLGIPPVGQPAMSHDGKYLFFCLAGDIYWVDAGFLEDLKPRPASPERPLDQKDDAAETDRGPHRF